MTYPVLLEAKRVVLRDFEDRDLDGCMTIVGDQRVTNSLSFDTRTRDQHAERLAADIKRAQTDPRPDYYLAVIEQATDDFLGFVRIGFDRPGTGEIGCAIRADRWGEGFATEACSRMLDYAFEDLGLHRVQAAIGPENAPSHKLVGRLGFTHEGQMRDHVFTNNGWRDSVLYSILDHEWIRSPR